MKAAPPAALAGPADLDALIAGLNEPQRRAVLAPPGPLIVCAGPGSGKTHTLTLRVAALIAHHGADPATILAVTFTNRAAREMRARVAALVDAATADKISLGTFHSLCARWLRRTITRIGRAPNFTIYDEDDTALLLRRLLADPEIAAEVASLRVRPADLSADRAAQLIGAAKAHQLTPRAYAAAAARDKSPLRQAVGVLYAAYQARLKEANALDFDDLIFATVTILERSPEALDELRGRYRHLLVDEVQDTARAQLRLLHLLSERHRSLFAVGDRAQSLYSWRFALPTLFDELLALYPEATLIKLEQNYRSTGAVCATAQALIDASREPSDFTTRIWTEREQGEAVRLGAFRSEVDEASRVADEAVRLREAGGYRLGDLAVIFRTNAQARALEEVFVKRALPYRLIGGVPFYARAEIKDMLALLRVLANSADSLSVMRMLNRPRRGVGEATRDALAAYARERDIGLYAALVELASAPDGPLRPTARASVGAFVALLGELREATETQSLATLLGLIAGRTSYRAYLVKEHGADEGEERWRNVLRLIEVAGRFAGPARATLDDFVAEATLMSDEDLDDADAPADRITCVTAYKAKGLEWPVVFVVGLNEGLLPHQRSIDARSSRLIEEERRVAYVALTRARDLLYISGFAYRTNTGGPPVRCQPSRFLADLPSGLRPFQIED